VISSNIARFEGRLFAENGRLCMVVETDEKAGTARVSTQVDGKHTLLDYSLTQVSERIAASGNLSLDNTSGANAKKRLIQKEEGWFYQTREGEQGPFESREIAERELGRFIVAKQSVDEAPETPRGLTPEATQQLAQLA